MKSKLILIIVVVLVLLGGGIGYYLYSSNAYTGYATAFNNSTKQSSVEYDTVLDITVDGETTKATGNMKIRDVTTNVNFVNVMDLENGRITQFTDGEYIYMDDGKNKTKYKIGEKPDTQPQGDEKGEFNIDYYIQEFSILLDASKIKDLKIAEKLNQNIIEKITKTSKGSGTEYEVVLAAQLVDDIFNTVIDEQFADEASPRCSLKEFRYNAAANKDKLIESVTYYVDMDVTFPTELTGESEDSTKSVQLELTMDYVNPGEPVEFDLPDTEGYQ